MRDAAGKGAWTRLWKGAGASYPRPFGITERCLVGKKGEGHEPPGHAEAEKCRGSVL